VHGLTTAAAIWESAAIGMAAGAGLMLLACTVTAMHFLIVVGFMPLARRLAARLTGSIRIHVAYVEGRGVMTSVLRACDRRSWQLSELSTDETGGVVLTLTGNGILAAPSALATIGGVTAIRQLDDDPD
jgi:putative Mg2+ transporter-C (MgtC) family protein